MPTAAHKQRNSSPINREGLPIPGVQLKGNRRVMANSSSAGTAAAMANPHRQSFFRPPENLIILRGVQPVQTVAVMGQEIVRRRNKGAIRRLRRAVDRRRRR